MSIRETAFECLLAISEGDVAMSAGPICHIGDYAILLTNPRALSFPIFALCGFYHTGASRLYGTDTGHGVRRLEGIWRMRQA